VGVKLAVGLKTVAVFGLKAGALVTGWAL